MGRRDILMSRGKNCRKTIIVSQLSRNYPLARNQYINNSPGVFSCIRTEINFPKIFLCIASGMRGYSHCIHTDRGARVGIHIWEGANTYFRDNPSKVFSCICASANTGPTCIHAKINSPRIFPACIGFVPGGTLTAGVILKEGKSLLLRGGDSLGGNLNIGDIWARVIPSQKLPGDKGDNFCRETWRCLARPSGFLFS